ncbi:SEL1-like repeat protein [Pseudomonas sp. UBA1879]|uniref:SEL1-like repeat protein n=1 Tax=Pseudomonas sp. UBA1879 TaxID=1947305 RepID=UPI0025E59D41|nr:DUF6396 domain-containing protein [Pseudomonas sp. UBA1879]
MKKLFATLFTLSITACDSGDKPLNYFIPEKADYDAAFERLQFECKHEKDSLPPLDNDAQLLYLYGLHLTQASGPKDFDSAARYYRIAAAFGHHRAATNLQGLLSQGLTKAERPARETINLVEILMNQGIPGSYYDMARYLESGYGVRQDISASRYYYRRAADLGSPEAQYYMSEILVRIKGAGRVALWMVQCAMEQGHAEAALNYAIHSKLNSNLPEALRAYRVAIKEGDSIAALSLEKAFAGKHHKNDNLPLRVNKDAERSRRYKLIGKFLTRYEHLGAKVPDIDHIVPLPPAPLPEWDETFEWKRKRDAAIPPPPPSEELIAKMCKEKELDPATGWPLTGLK